MSPLLFAMVDAVLSARYARAMRTWQLAGEPASGPGKCLWLRRYADRRRLGWWRSTW